MAATAVGTAPGVARAGAAVAGVAGVAAARAPGGLAATPGARKRQWDGMREADGWLWLQDQCIWDCFDLL